MPYEYKNPMLAGFYGHQQAQAEMGATEAEIAGRAAEARYRDSQVEDARLKRLLDMENAPYERKKLYREDVEGDAKLEQAQRDYLVQNVGPLLARVKRGEMPEMEFRAHAQNVVGQAASLFGADEEDVREMLSWSPKEWGLAYEQSMAYKDQVKAPPAVQDIISGDRKQQKQWNPETRRMEVVGEGPRFAPPRPPSQKYGVLTNDRGMPTGIYEIGPAGTDIQMLPASEGQGGGVSLPNNQEAVSGNIEAIAGQLGPGPRVKEMISKNVAPLLSPFLGKGGSNEERDAARSRYRAMRANLVELNKIPGGRSNLYLGLAMEGLPETGILENPDRAQNVLTDMTNNLRQAFDAAMATYQDPNTPKQVAVDAYRQAVGISALFDMLSQPLPGKERKAGRPAQPSGNRKIVVDY